jgi:hypothetical protein
MRRAITTSYNDLSARNNLIVDNPMLNQLVAIQGRYGEVLPVDAKRIVNRYIDDLTGQPVIPGNIYQNTRSRLDKQARGMRNSDPFTAGILSEIRDVADNAMARNLSPADKVLWDNTNRNFMVMKHIEKSIDTTTQNISPNLLINEVSRRSPQIAKYGEGPQGLVNIAKVGKQFIAPHIADSGTAQRSYMMKLLTNPLSALTQHGAAGLIGGPIAGVSSLVLPRLATNLMQSPGTYLTHGVQAYTPGRQRILEQLLQSAGAAGANQK